MKRSKLFYLLPALAFVACSKDSVEEIDAVEGTVETNEIVSDEVPTEVANFEAPGAVSEVFFAGDKIPVEEFNGDYVFQGDILISRDMVTTQEVQLVLEEGETPPAHKSVGRTSRRWPSNTVYYAIDPNLSNQARVIDAIKHWEANSNLKFVKRTSEANYVNFVTGSGCSSYVGMIGGKQNITLSSGCSTGNTIHEIGHAIGLWHEQSRVDRDSYVTINYDNIQKGREHNFFTYANQGIDGKEYTNTLDFGSLMMYGSYSFSGNGSPTMVKKDGSTFNVQRRGLSEGDKIGVNNMYPPLDAKGTSEPVYVNGEYYVVNGLRAFRRFDTWFRFTSRGWMEIKFYDQYWFYL